MYKIDYCILAPTLNPNCDFTSTFSTLHFYHYFLHMKPPFTPISKTVSCIPNKTLKKNNKSPTKRQTYLLSLISSLRSRLRQTGGGSDGTRLARPGGGRRLEGGSVRACVQGGLGRLSSCLRPGLGGPWSRSP